MTVTLYKNNQTEADTQEAVYTDQWSLEPYSPPSMFHAGETTEKAEFILPSDYTLEKYKTGKLVIKHFNRDSCIILTDSSGNPVLTVSGSTHRESLYRQGENPKAAKKNQVKVDGGAFPGSLSPGIDPASQIHKQVARPQSRTAYIPPMINGEYEIW
jgi:hypothetical protein